MGIYLPKDDELRTNVERLLDQHGYDEGVAITFNDCTPESWDRDCRGYVELIAPLNDGSRFPFEQRLRNIMEEAACAGSAVHAHIAVDGKRREHVLAVIRSALIDIYIADDFWPTAFYVDGQPLDVAYPDPEKDRLFRIERGCTGYRDHANAISIPMDEWPEAFQSEVDDALRPSDLDRNYLYRIEEMLGDYDIKPGECLFYIAEEEGEWDSDGDVYLNVSLWKWQQP